MLTRLGAVVGVALAALLTPTVATADTGTTVTAKRATFTGVGFDISSAPPTSVMRAWSASPYRAVNIYFSGTQRYDPTQTQLGSNPDWVRTVLSNGWAILPTVVDLQAPCALSKKKARMATDPATAASQGAAAATAAHNDLVKYGIGGTVAYLDLEPFDVTKSSACAPAVLAFVHAWVRTLHATREKAGIYVHWQRGAPTFVKDYDAGSTYRPDAVWVAKYDGNPNAATAVLGSRWLHHRIHQYWSDDPSTSNPDGTPETYGNERMSVDRDAIDGDVVALSSLSTPSGPPYRYYASGIPTGSTLKHRTQPSTTAPYAVTSANGEPLDIDCQATGETVDGDYVWDRLASDGSYVSDLYTTTTGRNWVSSAIRKCDTTRPSATLRTPAHVVVGKSVALSWTAADNADPAGTPPGETRGISSTTVRYRYASWHGRFGGWHSVLTPAQSLRLPLSAGYTYCVQVQSRDLSGNPSTWTPQSCFVTPLDDRSLTASSAWTRRTKSGFYLRTATDTRTAAASLTRTKAVAKQVGLVATTCAKCGSVRVSFAGHYLGTVDLRAASTHYRQVFLLPAFPTRSGTLTLRSTSNRLVQVDGVVLARA